MVMRSAAIFIGLFDITTKALAIVGFVPGMEAFGIAATVMAALAAVDVFNLASGTRILVKVEHKGGS
jgi:hypothetical protein